MGHMLIGGNLNQIFKPVIQLSSSHKMTEIRTPPPLPLPLFSHLFDFSILVTSSSWERSKLYINLHCHHHHDPPVTRVMLFYRFINTCYSQHL